MLASTLQFSHTTPTHPKHPPTQADTRTQGNKGHTHVLPQTPNSMPTHPAASPPKRQTRQPLLVGTTLPHPKHPQRHFGTRFFHQHAHAHTPQPHQAYGPAETLAAGMHPPGNICKTISGSHTHGDSTTTHPQLRAHKIKAP